jgi:hypothetical protein
MLPDTLAPGSPVRCPKCSTVLRLPGSPTPAQPAATAAKPSAAAKPPAAVPARPAAAPAKAPPPAAVKPASKKPAPPAPRPQTIKPAASKAPAVLPAGNEVRRSDSDDGDAPPKPKSKKGLLFGILGCVGLLVLGCGGAVSYGVYKLVAAGKDFSQQVKQKLDEAAKQIDEEQTKTQDLALVPAEINAAVVIHPARLVKSNSPLLPAADQQEQMLAGMIRETGIDPRQIERAILLAEPFPGGMPMGGPPRPGTGKGDWKPYVSQEGGFSALFPGTPRHTSSRDPQGSVTHTHLLELAGGKVTYMVMHNDLPAGATGMGHQFLFDTIARSFGREVKAKRNIKLEAYPGMELELEKKQGLDTLLITDRIYLIDKRMYQVMASATRDLKNPADFARFLDSFKPRKPTDAPMPPPGPGDQPASGGSNVLFFPAGILRFTEPIEGKKVLGGPLKEMEEAQASGKTYFRSKTEKMAQVPLAGFVANDRTILLAPEPTLKKMLAAQNVNSPLLSRLRGLDFKHDITGVFVVGPYKAALAELRKQPDLPPQLAGLRTLDRDLEAVTFTLDANGDTLLQIILYGTGNDGNAGVLLERLVNAALDMGKQMYGMIRPEMEKDMAKDLPPELAGKLMRLADQIDKGGIRVTREGNRVTITLEKPKDL